MCWMPLGIKDKYETCKGMFFSQSVLEIKTSSNLSFLQEKSINVIPKLNHYGLKAPQVHMRIKFYGYKNS